jgi:putative ABC transport system permease protein
MMFLNNLHASWHYLKHNRLFTLINIAGLVTGITCALFIFIYVSFETSYDRFHAGYENIYRVIGIDSALGVSSNNVGITMPPLGPAMEEAIPAVEETLRLQMRGGMFITVGDQNYYADSLVSTEDAFFDIFSFPLLQRQGEVLLDKPHSAVLTESFARKVFGSADAMGKIFRVRDQDLEVVGIMADPPPNSHM